MQELLGLDYYQRYWSSSDGPASFPAWIIFKEYRLHLGFQCLLCTLDLVLFAGSIEQGGHCRWACMPWDLASVARQAH
jgi:hypothetical protein